MGTSIFGLRAVTIFLLATFCAAKCPKLDELDDVPVNLSDKETPRVPDQTCAHVWSGRGLCMGFMNTLVNGSSLNASPHGPHRVFPFGSIGVTARCTLTMYPQYNYSGDRLLFTRSVYLRH